NHNNGVISTGLAQCRLEAGRHRQQSDQDTDHSRNADHHYRRRPETLRNGRDSNFHDRPGLLPDARERPPRRKRQQSHSGQDDEQNQPQPEQQSPDTALHAQRPDKASTIRSRMPRSAGRAPTMSPMATIRHSPSSQMDPSRGVKGSVLPSCTRTMSITTPASVMPIAPPSTRSNTASARTSARIL